MTKRKSPVLAEEKEPAHSLNLYITGEPLPVTIGKATVYLRQPSYLERDQADFQESLFSRHIEVEDDEVRFLSESPAPKKEIERIKTAIGARETLLQSETDEIRKRVMNDRLNFMYDVIEGRHAAESLLETYSARVKKRWLAKNLVIDKEGSRLDYDKMHPAIQDVIMEAVDTMLEDIDTIPLGLA